MARVLWLNDTPAASEDDPGSGARGYDARRARFQFAKAGDKGGSQGIDRVSDAEIGQLVSAALEDALIALGKHDPEEFLRLRARQARGEMHETFASLPYAQRSDPTIVSEYGKAIMFRNLALDLALEMVGVISRFAGFTSGGDPPTSFR